LPKPGESSFRYGKKAKHKGKDIKVKWEAQNYVGERGQALAR